MLLVDLVDTNIRDVEFKSVWSKSDLRQFLETISAVRKQYIDTVSTQNVHTNNARSNYAKK